jgi:alkylation response protein AidB-like acyl-CoA dehydrogenase
MDFSLGEDRQMLVDSLSRFLADNFDWKAREAAIGSDEGFSRELWNELAELGVIGSWFAEDAGGYGGGAFDVGATFGELGRALATGPFLGSLMAGKMLEALGDHAALEAMISGESIVTFAHDPAIGGGGAPLGDVTAKQADGGWTLTGAKGVVEYLGSADKAVVTSEGSAFLVDLSADGVTVHNYPLVDGGSAGELQLDGAPATLLGEAGKAGDAIDAARAMGLVAVAWEGVAVMDVLRAMTLDYLRTRKQFGVPIGKFQALQHRMATVALEIEQARSAAINAAANFDKDPATRDRFGSAAKYTLGAVGSLAAEEAIQLHGGIGMTWELPLSHYAKRMVMLGHVLGDEDEHLARFVELGKAA